MSKETFGMGVVSAGPAWCWPWAHDWTAWQPRIEVHDGVIPHPDGKRRVVANTYRHRHCRKCPKTQSYLYDCKTYEA